MVAIVVAPNLSRLCCYQGFRVGCSFKDDLLQRNDGGVDDADVLGSINDEIVIDYPTCRFGDHRRSPNGMELSRDILFNKAVGYLSGRTDHEIKMRTYASSRSSLANALSGGAIPPGIAAPKVPACESAFPNLTIARNALRS